MERMDGLIPWQRLQECIRPFYPKVGKGRRPYPLVVMRSMKRPHLLGAALRGAWIHLRVSAAGTSGAESNGFPLGSPPLIACPNTSSILHVPRTF